MRRLALRAAAVAAACALLFVLNNGYDRLTGYWQDLVLQCGIAVIMAVSLNIVNGFTGQFSIGHAGFMAVGAYAGGAVGYLAFTPFKEAMRHAHPRWTSAELLAHFNME